MNRKEHEKQKQERDGLFGVHVAYSTPQRKPKRFISVKELVYRKGQTCTCGKEFSPSVLL